jgi:hypothetical protein
VMFLELHVANLLAILSCNYWKSIIRGRETKVMHDEGIFCGQKGLFGVFEAEVLASDSSPDKGLSNMPAH